MSHKPAATRLALVAEGARPADPVVRRYRLARLRPVEAPPEPRYAYLKRTHD